MEYFPLLLKNIDEGKYLPYKINVLTEALCTLLYDHTIWSEEYSDKENQERDKIADIVRPELIKRKDRILKAGDSVMEYIRDEVYPQIGLKDTN